MRTARARHYLMCRPTYFDVVYSINPWMDPKKPVDTPLAIAQWERLREVYLSLGHTVDTIEPVRGLPDMVFAANGATVVDGRALVARFRTPSASPRDRRTTTGCAPTGSRTCVPRASSTKGRATTCSWATSCSPGPGSAAIPVPTTRPRSSSAAR